MSKIEYANTNIPTKTQSYLSVYLTYILSLYLVLFDLKTLALYILFHSIKIMIRRN